MMDAEATPQDWMDSLAALTSRPKDGVTCVRKETSHPQDGKKTVQFTLTFSTDANSGKVVTQPA